MRFKPWMSAVLLLLVIAGLSLPSVSQSRGQNPGQFPGASPNPGLPPDDRQDQARAKIEKEMAKKANHERQVQLQRDTDSLLKLANELKQDVDKSNENTLSLAVVKKAEEIEKLAHSVKEKMKAH